MGRRLAKSKRELLVLRSNKSAQQIPVIWGLRHDVYPGPWYSPQRLDPGMTLVDDDTTLMAMDAPEVMPAGCCYSEVLDPETHRTGVRAVLRESWRWVPRA